MERNANGHFFCSFWNRCARKYHTERVGGRKTAECRACKERGMEVAIAVLAAAVLAGGGFIWRRRRAGAAGSETGAPVTRMEAYALGMQPGADGQSVMYTLRSCRHCVRLKKFLDAHHIPCRLVYVDEFKGAERAALMGRVRACNPRGSFPTLVLPDGRVVVGFREREIRAAYGLPESD